LEIEELGDRKKAPENWPSNGAIEFRNVSLSYGENQPNVLKNLTFKIRAGEKIGIVGRTGAGKSSIIKTLYRMCEPDGDMFIDNVNIGELNLYDLRSKLSIIPVNTCKFNRSSF
jgi:ATP-binding cassette subfamily C (CFTR/MRP) protein 1